MPARKKITIQLAQLSQDKCWYFYIKAGKDTIATSKPFKSTSKALNAIAKIKEQMPDARTEFI